MTKAAVRPLRAATIELKIESLCGGFPGSIDAMRTYMQSPAMVKRVPADVREQFLADEPFPEQGEDGAETGFSVVRTGFRKRPDGSPWIGAWQVKACLQGAARSLYTTTSRPNIYQMARAITYNLEILPHEIPLLEPSEEQRIQIAQIIAHPRNPNIKVPSQRDRAMIRRSHIAVHALVLTRGPGELLLDELEALFEAAGTFVGLGTDRGYGHGRFTVTRFGWEGDAPAELVDDVPVAPARKGIGYERKRAT